MNRTHISCVSSSAGEFFTYWAIEEVLKTTHTCIQPNQLQGSDVCNGSPGLHSFWKLFERLVLTFFSFWRLLKCLGLWCLLHPPSSLSIVTSLSFTVTLLPASFKDFCAFLGHSDNSPQKRKWQPTPVFLPRELCGQRSLAGYSSWDCKNWTWFSTIFSDNWG